MSNETEISEGDKVFNERGNRAVKALKAWCKLISELPDEVMPLDEAKLDELFKPITETFWLDLEAMGDVTGDELDTALNHILPLFVRQSATRVSNHAKNIERAITKATTGYYEVNKEMPIAEFGKKLVLLKKITESEEYKALETKFLSEL